MSFRRIFFRFPSATAAMPSPSIVKVVLTVTILLTGLRPAFGNGIYVRFLANPPEDSIAQYAVYRSDSAGDSGVILGKLPSVAGQDTMSFPDRNAVKGRPYFYSIKAIGADGGESDPSGVTEIAFPALSLPDTLRPDPSSRLTRIPLAAGSCPMGGAALLSLSLLDSTRFLVTLDTAAHAALFQSRSGKADTARVIVRAAYFGKFEDEDTALLIVAASGATSLRDPGNPGSQSNGAGPRLFVPASFSPTRQSAMTLRNVPGPGSLEIFTAMGSRVYARDLAAPQDEFSWDGKDEAGIPLRPARYVLLIRAPGGRILDGRGFSLFR